MEFINATGMQAGYTQGLRPDGRELLVVVVKGTFNLPEIGEEATLADVQLPLTEADVYSGEPGFSAPLYESDYAPYKPRCDVLLNGSAYAPPGKRATKVTVGIRVGEVSKIFNVVGDRSWEAGAGGIGPGFATPFEKKEISYNVAFGGTDRFAEDSSLHDAFMANPSGLGYRKGLTTGPIDGTPVPNTEERDNPVTSPIGKYRPMSFGPIARSWEPRYRLAGTYDDEWLENTFPFLPADFDDRYFQCAPENQQTDFLKGGEPVTLINLTPNLRREFRVPLVELPVHIFRVDDDRIDLVPNADTICIEPDLLRFTITWRTHVPLKRNMFEVSQAVVGSMSRAWWRAREFGKTYYAGLSAASRNARGSDPDDAA